MSKSNISRSQDDLRRLMKEKRHVLTKSQKKIQHPFAKYNNVDQLVCTLCSKPIKSDLQWNAHLQSRTHKENFESQKHNQELSSIPRVELPATTKRKPVKCEDNTNLAIPKEKRVKLETAPVTHPKSILKNSNSSQRSEETLDSDEQVSKPSSLPTDFFDSSESVPIVKTNQKSLSASTVKSDEPLPEGFFDDPKQDAIARNIEYINKEEEEWERFQRAIKEENHVSEAIMQEEDAVDVAEREIDEIEDQLQRWSKIDQLQKTKESLTSSGNNPTDKVTGDTDSSSDVDEDTLENLLDWRQKTAWH